MSDPNPFISNGTCYHGAGRKSSSDVLPCGNAALGTRHCCASGDMCLEDKFCLAEVLNRTYVAACTDPTYQDAKCDQATEGSRWSSIAICARNSSPGNVLLTYCVDSGAEPSEAQFNECDCPSDSGEEPYYVKNSFYDEMVLLPSSKGQSLVWQPGHVPTSSGDSSSTSETGAGATVTVVAGGNDDGGDDDGGAPGAIGVGVQVGIGVGVSLAALLVIGAMFPLWRRRTKGRKAAEATKARGPGDVAELPVRAMTPPPGELAADTSWPADCEMGSGEEKGGGAAGTDGAGGGRRAVVGDDGRAARTASVVSELP